MTEQFGLQKSDYGREGIVALFDFIIGLLQEKISTIAVVYGTRVSHVSPLYTASFVKAYNDLPVVAMSVDSNQQEEVGMGQIAKGPTHGQYSGMLNYSGIEFSIWARNRLEMEAIGNAVMNTLQQNKKYLSGKGVIDYRLSRMYDQPFDPNAPRMWFGSTQAPGEIWIKTMEYNMKWIYVWSPNAIEGIGEIKKIGVYLDQDGGEQSFDLGLAILGLLDSMYLERNLGDGIKIVRTGGRH